jgi:hypothetical protein
MPLPVPCGRGLSTEILNFMPFAMVFVKLQVNSFDFTVASKGLKIAI